MVKAAEYCPEEGVGDEDRDGGAESVVKSEKAWGFEISGGGGTMGFAGHAGMDSGKQWENDYEKKECVNESDQRADPPSCAVQRFEDEDIDEGERESVEEMDDGAVKVSAVAIVGKDTSDEESKTHAGCAEPLADTLHGGEDCGGDDCPK